MLVVIGEEGEQLLRAVESRHGREPPVAAASRSWRSSRPSPAAAVRATPAVRQLARELGVDLVGLPGSGPSGRIVEADVRGAAATATRRRRGGASPSAGIRRAIVEQVSRAHREVPAVTFVEECDFTGVDLAPPRAARDPRGRRRAAGATRS